MEKIIYDGETYYIKKGIVYDSMFLEVSSSLAKLVFAKKYENFDYKSLNEEQLLAHIKDLKNAENYEICIDTIKFGLDKFAGCNTFYRIVFPILTSCYRSLKQPQKAVDFWIENRYVNSNCISTAFLTSVAGAYCDIEDYETALTLADRAFAIQGGGAGCYNELSNVYARIKKAMGDNYPK